jgi:signal transduction histidine kinase
MASWISTIQMKGVSCHCGNRARLLSNMATMTTLQTVDKMRIATGSSFKLLVVIVAFAVLGLAGWIDLATGDVSVSILYLFPICLCTWVFSRTSGMAMAFTSVLIALRADIAERQHYRNILVGIDLRFVPYWNAVMLLLLFTMVVWLLWAVKQFQSNLEAKIDQRTIDLITANSELKAAQKSLVEGTKLELVGRIAAGIAHEVKNPLMTIAMAVDFFAQAIPPSDPDGAVMIRDIREAVDRASRVISELLELSRPSELLLKPENLQAIADHSLGLVKMDLIRKHIVLVREFNAPITIWQLDKNKMVQVFLNIFMNAIQAMPMGGVLTVKTRASQTDYRQASGIVVEIDDTGPGIFEQNLTKLFEPFFTTKPTGEGTGLGLSVSGQIVKQHGGTLALTNRPEGGARATLAFNLQ